VLMFLGFYLFIELCPDDVVEEHTQGLRYGYTLSQQPPKPQPPEETQTDVIDGEFHEVSEPEEEPSETETPSEEINHSRD
jgi:hypothetical protein